MKCPLCGHDDSKVIDSRPTENASIRRRRECLACRHRFTTYEFVEQVPLFVIKKDGSKEIFDRQKLLAGLIKSCYKRPVSSDQLDALARDIESELVNSLRTEVPSKEIGTMAMDRLRELDEVSYVRFASVYRDFRDIETFLAAIEQLQHKKPGRRDASRKKGPAGTAGTAGTAGKRRVARTDDSATGTSDPHGTPAPDTDDSAADTSNPHGTPAPDTDDSADSTSDPHGTPAPDADDSAAGTSDPHGTPDGDSAAVATGENTPDKEEKL